jgi:hypothetical protein
MQDPRQLQAQGLDFSQAQNYTCEKCDNDRFVVNYLIKKFSALLSPTGNEMLTPIQAFACSNCGHINKDFLPESESLL